MNKPDLRRVFLVRHLAANGTLRTKRDEGMISLREMADCIGADGIPHSTLSRWERGISVPSPAGALAWAEALEELLGESLDARSAIKEAV